MQAQIISKLRQAAGPHFVALYLVGSYGTAEQIETSDMDLVLVHADEMPANARGGLMAARDRLRQTTGEMVDVRPMALSWCLHNAFSVKRVGTFLAGEDVRDRIREQSIEEQADRFTAAGMMFVRRLRTMPPEAPIDAQNLDYPASADGFRGYVFPQDPLPLHRLMSLSFLATARLAQIAHVVPRSKHDLPELYRRHFHDGTEDFVNLLFDRVRRDWQYRLPSTPAERRELSAICASALSFERLVCADLLSQRC